RDDFPATELAGECWNPCVIGNMRTLLSGNVLLHARKEVERTGSLCCAFGRSASTIVATVFAPAEEIESLFTEFAHRCKFSHPALERGFASIRESVPARSRKRAAQQTRAKAET